VEKYRFYLSISCGEFDLFSTVIHSFLTKIAKHQNKFGFKELSTGSRGENKPAITAIYGGKGTLPGYMTGDKISYRFFLHISTATTTNTTY
jgi:hypothetical protein